MKILKALGTRSAPGGKNKLYDSKISAGDRPTCPITVRTLADVRPISIYRVFQKTDTQFYFWDNFGNSTPILTILSLLQAKIYGA